VLHPGTRLHGSRTWLGAGAQVGTEGPATVVDTVFDEAATIASGYVNGAVLLKKACLGANAHVRPGTLLEEEASTAHAVGLKQTLLLSFVTLGSLINFCDCLMAGGTSRKDHAEVGSGYIHFNFTPWGKSGDKATPSLIGDVPRGVFLRERRIFLGGTGGLVGPAQVGFGAVAGAGQVVRNGIEEGHLVIQAPRGLDRPVEMSRLDPILPRATKNIRYIGNLFALRAWYQKVRLPSTPRARTPVMEAAIALIEGCIEERIKQLGRFLEERGAKTPSFSMQTPLPCPLRVTESVEDHVAWVKALTDEEVAIGVTWLETIVESVSEAAEESLRAGLPG
jgi:UDP-N-acetylglucosamine/UDP-N-acetylgalactosamine diphosphorylase